jgi:hypothetical protein
VTTALLRIEELMAHSAPGLAFGPHQFAKLPRRVHATAHAWGGALSVAEREELDRLTLNSSVFDDLHEVYQRANGACFFLMESQRDNEAHWGFQLLPIEAWREITDMWLPGGDYASFMEKCDLYKHGEWRVIAMIGDGGMFLIQFFSGERDGESLAGRIFCVGLGGLLGYEEEVAESFSSLIESVVRDPAAFFCRMGFTWSVESEEGCFGDPLERYVSDVRGDPDVQPWPAKV